MDKEVWSIYRKEYYSAIKRNGMGSSVVMWMNLKSVTESEIRQKREKQMLYINASIWNLEKWN